MKEIIFVKYSNERDDRFKIKTVISQDNEGNRYVQKHALTAAAKKHLEQIAEHGRQLNHCAKDTKFRFNKCVFADGILDCAYIKGEPLSAILNQKVLSNDHSGALELVQEYCCELHKMATEPFYVTEAFQAIFGNVEFDCEQKSCPVTDIDMIFSNVIVSENNWDVLDYEWTYGFPIPVKYVIFREILAASETVGVFLMDHLDQLGISKDEFQKFMEMESRFQQHVNGDETPLYQFHNMQKRAGLASAAEVEALNHALLQKQTAEEHLKKLLNESRVYAKTLVDAVHAEQSKSAELEKYLGESQAYAQTLVDTVHAEQGKSAELEKLLAESRTYTQTLITSIQAEQNRSSELEMYLTESRNYVQSLAEDIRNEQEQSAVLNSQLTESREIIAARTAELNQIYQSRWWKLLKYFFK